MQFQTEELKAFRTSLVEHMVSQVQKLNRDNFAVKQHLKYVELYADKNSYNALTYADTLIAREELAPLIEPEPDDPKALRFDALLYGIELAYLAGKPYNRGRSELLKKRKRLRACPIFQRLIKNARCSKKLSRPTISKLPM